MKKEIRRGISVCVGGKWDNTEMQGEFFLLVKRKDTQGLQISELINVLDLEGYYRGPGQFFVSNPLVRETKNRILFHQTTGYDI